MDVIGALGSGPFHNLQCCTDMKVVWNPSWRRSPKAESVEIVSCSVESEVLITPASVCHLKKWMLIYLHFRDTVGGELLRVCKPFYFTISKQCYLARMRALVNNCNHGFEFIIVRHLLFNKFSLRAFLSPSLVSNTLVKASNQIYACIILKDLSLLLIVNLWSTQ